ncbi:MAG: hypothetical protein DPW09_32960 [Anaerolineae bacterium]|nr:hypothetical protein [Anaerolineales bacterium]MCQ3978263.1 hypothetical protein [Anaerolineae bacterium]
MLEQLKTDRIAQIMLVGVVVAGCFACSTIGATVYVALGRTLTLPTQVVQQPVVAQEQLPTPTLTSVPEPTNTSEPTNTPTTTPTSYPTATPTTPLTPRADINVCDVEFNDEYLHSYVKWTGMVMHKPFVDDDGSQSFMAQIFPPDERNSCFRPFFVRYEGAERIYAEDLIEVTGAILTTNYEFEGATGTREHIVMILADEIKIIPVK